MKKIKIGLIVLSLIALVGLVGTGMAMAKNNGKDSPVSNFEKILANKYVQDEIIVKFKEDKKPFRVIKIPQGKVGEKIKEYLGRADVEYAEPNYIVSIQTTPNDPDFSKLWGLNNTGQTGGTPDADIDALESWGTQTGSNNVVIAVIDTGVDYNHLDLAANIWTNLGEIPGNGIDDDGNGYVDDIHGWDFVNNDNDPFDDNGHGTHCAGTIGAVGNNGIGVVGVNWNVKIMPMKFLSSGGSGTTADAIKAINYATLMGAHIMSNSWGGGGYSQALKDAITAANSAGILFVAAAGNSGSSNDVTPAYPASYDVPNVVAVAATDHNDLKASWSNYGANSVDLGAPGVDIYSTLPGNSYGYKSGTSMATPHVSGVAGLIKAQFPTLKSDGIKLRLLNSVDKISSLAGLTITEGRLNANNSLEIDEIPPSAVTNFVAGGPTINSITLTWTAPGDDGNTGTASAYDVRYSTSEITDLNWNTAAQSVGEPKPSLSGSTETFTVTGLDSNTTYYFALKTLDNVGNASGLSNVTSETTKIPFIAFKDNMESGINGWTHSGTGDNWQLGTPTSGPGYAYSGSNVWATNLSGNYGINYMNARLISPSIDLSSIKSSQLNFQHYYYTENYYDGGIVEVSADGGTTWTQITPIGGYPEDALNSGNPLGPVPAYSGYSGAGWHEAKFNISSYDGNNNIKIRFRFGTDSSVNSYPGWYIDDVVVLGEPVAPNNPPVADNQSVSTNEDTSVSITLTAADIDNDPLTYAIVSNPSNGILSGIAPNVTYTPNANYYGNDSFTFKAKDGKSDSNIATVSIAVNAVNDPPIANAGPDKTGYLNQAVAFDGSGSYDPDGSIVSYDWNFGDGSIGSGVTTTHAYSATGTYTVTLTVTDNASTTASDNAVVTVLSEAPAEIAVFGDSFEVSEWNGLWTEDSQNDWFRSTQRAVNGRYSAEVDGRALDAKLISIPINLQGRTNATITFSWFIESGLDLGEYLAFDVSTNGGATWVEKVRLKGNVDPENVWHNVSIDLTGINNLRIQFRGTMSDATEDADVDMVKVTAR